jgi:hypothetical protein
MNRKAAVVVALLLLVSVLIGPGCIAQSDQGNTEEQISLLFVQTAGSGSFTPIEGKDGSYLLTLNDVSPVTIYFSDRPYRVAGHLEMERFLEVMDFQVIPPNAAVDVIGPHEENDLVVVELCDPQYDLDEDTLKYTVSVLKEPDHSYAVFNERHDGEIPGTFGAASVYIDNEDSNIEECFEECYDEYIGWDETRADLRHCNDRCHD